MAVDLSKQQPLDADPRANQQINFTVNLDRAGNTRIYFIPALGIFYQHIYIIPAAYFCHHRNSSAGRQD